MSDPSKIMSALELEDRWRELCEAVLALSTDKRCLTLAAEGIEALMLHAEACDEYHDEEENDAEALASAGYGTDEDYLQGERL